METTQTYPKTMTKGPHERTVTTAEQETNLRFDGWRDKDAPPPERGAFLPPVEQPPAAAPEPDVAEPPDGADGSAEASASQPSEPAKRRRRADAPST